MLPLDKLYWVVWRSLDGQERSTLHPYSIPAVLDDVDRRLQAQYDAFVADKQPNAEAFKQSVLRPDYRFHDTAKKSHAVVTPPLPDDLLRCRVLEQISPQQTSTECDRNIVFMTQLAGFMYYEYTDRLAPSYEASARAHAWLLQTDGQRPPDALFRPRPATRKLMRLLRN